MNSILIPIIVILSILVAALLYGILAQRKYLVASRSSLRKSDDAIAESFLRLESLAAEVPADFFLVHEPWKSRYAVYAVKMPGRYRKNILVKAFHYCTPDPDSQPFSLLCAEELLDYLKS